MEGARSPFSIIAHLFLSHAKLKPFQGRQLPIFLPRISTPIEASKDGVPRKNDTLQCFDSLMRSPYQRDSKDRVGEYTAW